MGPLQGGGRSLALVPVGVGDGEDQPGLPGLRVLHGQRAGCVDVGDVLAHQDPLQQVRAKVEWLLAEGLVDWPKLKALWPYVTGGGDVARAQVVGYDERPGPTMRVELVIDAAHTPPRQIYWKDLRLLTSGDVREMIGGETPATSRPTASRRRAS